MALPLSGQISMDDIRVELGVPSQSPFGLDEARSGTYVAINQCSTYKPPVEGTVSLSDWYGYNQTQACPATATLQWSLSLTGGAVGTMDLYVNGTIVETRTTTSGGTYTVNQGDTIAMDLNMNQCTGGDNYANVSTSGIISDQDCAYNNTVSLFTSNYTVQAGDVGTTIYFNGFLSCEAACL